MVTMENAEEYVELMFDFCMHTGIQKQMEAFRGITTPLIYIFMWDAQHEDSSLWLALILLRGF